MDDQLLLQVYHRLFAPGKVCRPAGCVYSDSIIVLVHFLAVLRVRSMLWAHDKRNWPLWMRRLPCLSYSQLMRRLKGRPVRERIARLYTEYRGQLPDSAEKFCDGKPLPVGGCSKDPDARPGRLPGGGWGRGYRLHVITDACGAVDLFTVTGLDAGEPTVMRRLVALADLRGVTLRGDSNYDSNDLYAAVAARGGRLIAPRKKPHTGLGHHRQHPDRLWAIAELEQTEQSMRAHRRERIHVEQTLGHVSNLPFGLGPLPNCVRRHRRVALWTLSKLTLYHLYLVLMLRQDKTLAA